MGGEVVQLCGALMVFVMGAVVISSGHIKSTRLQSYDLPGFRVGFLGQDEGPIGVFKGALGMPVTSLVVTPFVVFGSGPMGVSGKFMLFGGFTTGFMHGGVLLADG